MSRRTVHLQALNDALYSLVDCQKREIAAAERVIASQREVIRLTAEIAKLQRLEPGPQTFTPPNTSQPPSVTFDESSFSSL